VNPANLKQLAEQIAIPVRHLRYLLEQIEWHIPKATVWAFGSRVKWSHRPESDMDLAVHCDKETARKGLPRLNDALEESDLPFKVQILDFNRLPENMQENIKKNYLVLYPPQESILPSGWKETTLGEVAEVQTGPFGSQLHEKDYVATGTPIITVENLVNDCINHSADTPKVSEDDKARLSRYILNEGDIVFSRVGSVDRCAYVSGKEDKWLFSGRLLRVRPAKEVFNKYVFYWISQPAIKEYVRKIAVGATMPSINTELLSQVPISFPPLPEQKAIAAILSSFDDKIELLRRQNRTLEQIAQTIFKEWFVNFTVNGKKLKLNSKSGLPEGWRMGKLTDVIEVSPDRNLRRGELAPYLDMKGMPTQGHHAEGWYKREFTSGSKFINGDTLLARITPCLENGKTAFVDFLDEDQVGWGSTEFIVLRPKLPFTPFYGYLLARSNPFRNFAIGQMTGTSGRQRVPEDSLGNLDVIIPTGNILAKFGELIEPIEKRLTMNAKEIQTLSKLRDTLLPKLMKGEIRVKDTNILVKERTK
jgi:type I restriction enzyme S subunit